MNRTYKIDMDINFHLGFAILAFLATGLFSTATFSDEPEDDLSAFKACRQILDDAQRLDCYDDALDGADERRVVAEREAEERRKEQIAIAERSAKENFGKAVEDREEVQAEENESSRQAKKILEAAKEPDRIKATVISFSITPVGSRKIFILDNGQAWRETDGSRFRRNVREGTEVEIFKRKLGGYGLKVIGKSGMALVRRLR